MARFVCWVYKIWSRRLNNRFKDKYALFKLVVWSFFYNSFVDVYYVADTAMEPIFWFVDHFTRFFGPLFVFTVCSLTGSIVVIAYMVGIPYWWHRNPVTLFIILVIGNWLLVNVVFHYYMAAITAPGFPPQACMIPEAVTICKRCIAPKPPRTHHCSICNRCILKMDHHCPWMNTCIGHFNHRYFFLFCVYMVAGALFLLIFGFNVFYDHFTKYKGLQEPLTLEKLITLRYDPAFPWQHEAWYHGVLTYAALLCIGVTLALGTLAVWHYRLISQGETSIEAHINKSETARYKKDGKVYLNPYNFGVYNNWMLFLGLVEGRTWRHVLLPSTHLPVGNALQWSTIHDNKQLDFCRV